MPVHQRVRAWIAQHYQKPAIDQEWLADCSDWISSELGLDPSTHFDQFVQHVEAQLLQSNLADSTVPGSGIDPSLVALNPAPPPANAQRPARQRKNTGTTPLLVEVMSVTEIAHSAFSLLNIHQTRLDRADLGLAHEENAEQQHDEDEGPVPRFPRGMLRFELSDGSTTFKAIEFRSLPQLELGTTPLGYKMFLKSTPIRNGIAFLEPANVTLKGYRTEDHDVNSEQVFLSSLRKRLGRPDPQPETAAAAQPRVNPLEPAPAQPARQHQLPPVVQPPTVSAGIDDMYVDDDVDPDVLREMAIQMDEEIDMQDHRRGDTRAPPPAKPPLTSKQKPAAGSSSKQTLRLGMTTAFSLSGPSTSSAVNASPYFTAHSSESKPIPDIGLSPRSARAPDPELDFDIPWDVDDPQPRRSLVRKLDSTSARPAPTSPVEYATLPLKQPSSPDSFDDLSFDMNMDESFLQQVGMIEQGALGRSTNNKGKGKAKDTRVEGRPNVEQAKKTLSSVPGTKSLVKCLVPPSSAEPSTIIQSNTKRATSTSSLSRSTESPVPQSSRSSSRRLPRDPSLIVVSSSEDETPRGRRMAKPRNLARRRASDHRGKMDHGEVPDSEVIDISD